MAQAASVEELLKAGAHFGHLTRRWNPKMREFIFMQRNGIHIIDLNKTQKLLQESLDELAKVARSGKNILFVGTKKQAQEIIRNEAQRCGMPYVTDRWLGGMLTNFVTMKKNISRMGEIDQMKQDGTYDHLTKKERLMLDREQAKLEQVLGGISHMNRLPGAIFVVDIVKEDIAVKEALKLNIPIFAMVDTNCDPDIPDYIIPSNDDAAKAIQLITTNVAEAVIEGAAEREEYKEEQLAMETMKEESTEKGQESAPTDESEVKTTSRRKRTRKKEEAATGEQAGEQSGEQSGKQAETEGQTAETDTSGDTGKQSGQQQAAAASEEQKSESDEGNKTASGSKSTKSTSSGKSEEQEEEQKASE